MKNHLDNLETIEAYVNRIWYLIDRNPSGIQFNTWFQETFKAYYDTICDSIDDLKSDMIYKKDEPPVLEASK